jgi:S-DNA-T family DNA segregation ATPase FtsK/SpoIIIE
MPPASPKPSRAAEFMGVACFAFALMLLVSLGTYNPHDPAAFFKTGTSGVPVRNFIGPFGAFLAELLEPQLFGLAAFLIPIVLAAAGWNLFWCRPTHAPYTKALGLTLLLLSLTVFLTLSLGSITFHEESMSAGGAVGLLLTNILTESFNRAGAYIIVISSMAVAIILSTQLSLATILSLLGRNAGERMQAAQTAWAHRQEVRRKERLRREVIRKHTQKAKSADGVSVPRRPSAEISTPSEPATARATTRAQQRPLIFEPSEAGESGGEPTAAARASAKRNGFVLPPTSLLDQIPAQEGPERTHLFEKAKILQGKAREFGVNGSVVEIHPGPVVTTYEFKPDAGIKYSKVVGLADDLALALEAESIRIDRMSGRGSVAIEIPNEACETISLREIIQSDAFQKARSSLTLALGKTVNGDVAVTNLAQMPHLLIAGATGTGKSVGLNCMITSMLMKATPEEVRLLLIDPKRLELGVYEDVPHLLAPVVTEPKMAGNVLKWAVGEMERRIRMLASEGVRNIDQFNNILRAEKRTTGEEGEVLRPLHYIVIIIDELADLMMVSSNDVEESITRLAQMARAVGIHLILATQRPSVDVITGLIKANFPSRISFKVSARVDSRTILDSIGAEHLLGRGDMLFLPPGTARLVRIHGAYVSEQEIARLTTHLRKTARPVYDESVGRTDTPSDRLGDETRDDLFDEAVRFVLQSGQASTSMLQRRFRIGFSRAGRLIDSMERQGIIGPADGSKAREVLMTPEEFEPASQASR